MTGQPTRGTGGAERERLHGAGDQWKRWGPYVSERAWGTVREDYSPDGDAWDYLPHDCARSHAYRWNEDGLAGICDLQQQLCLSLALWNGQDPILKERLFGLNGHEGNHGEDVKEAYFYLDNTPTHSYMRMLYKYPQAPFPYDELVAVNRGRTRMDPEYELLDTGIFDQHRYFDVFVEYAKASPDDILVRMTAHNRGPDAADLVLAPTLWFRNTWSWSPNSHKPQLSSAQDRPYPAIKVEHPDLPDFSLACEGAGELLFTENETNLQRLYNAPEPCGYVKDAFHRYLIQHEEGAVNPAHEGTKACAVYRQSIPAGQSITVRLRLGPPIDDPFADFDQIFAQRQSEADGYYREIQPASLSDDQRMIQRQALAGMLWSKQFYHYNVKPWLDGDPTMPPPPPQRKEGRNHNWFHLRNHDVISMPDTWEYPWYASWDLAFHCITLALVDSEFAKAQIDLLLREWYQHPNGQVPAYEWAFGDVNPPVLAWAAWRVYKIEKKQRGKADRVFLERIFHKMLLNFTWWVNRKDSEGKNVFQGGFLGLDNIGVFDRSAPLPTGGYIEQSDGTSWMAMFCLDLLEAAIELARDDSVYQDIATKFFDHFLYIAAAMNDIGDEGFSLWDDQDEFFYDVLRAPDGRAAPLKVRSLVGLIPLFAVTTIDQAVLDACPEFAQRLDWFLDIRPDLAALISRWHEPGAGERRQLALVRGHRLKRLLARALDPNEFLSDYGIRALSKYHQDHPYHFNVDGQVYSVNYEPGESTTGTFGGNSNWRGPIWFPVNYLLIEALQRFHHYYSDDFLVECPTGSGQKITLRAIADDLSRRLMRLFERDEKGNRPFNGDHPLLQKDPHWRDYILFHEYFHGDSGFGLGASHQTGWTGLVAKLIQQQGESA
ncbi:MAG TPA: glucosidase [Chloroflexota bacterium]|nr:glucosidase [Chloroflexota bacterium]